MSVRKIRVLVVLFLCLITLGALTTGTHAEQRFVMAPEAIGSGGHVVASGGGASSGGPFTLRGTIGQAAAGVATGGPYRLNAGFWAGGGVGGARERSVFLPLVLR